MEFSWEVKLTREPLEVNRSNFRPEEGAVVDFYGVVREIEGNRLIAGIEYEAFECMAERLLAQIAQAAGDQHQVSQVTLHHRVGFVPVGEPSLFLRVCSERRAAAFRASADIIEKLKALVPIWKHPVYAAAQVT
jgi:molybdopterin synthase catalytic subunit